VIVVGELRDAETMQLALSAAETGHLVFGTLHTSSAMKTMTRVVDMVPSERQSQVRAQFADVLRGVVTQRLVKKRGGGRLGAYEILLNNSAVTNSIREDKPAMIEAAMNDRATGMQTLERALAQFVIQNWLDVADAQHAANDVSKLQEEIDAVRRPAGQAGAHPVGGPAAQPSRPSWMNPTRG
jgi:twitching motility protein PilT